MTERTQWFNGAVQDNDQCRDDSSCAHCKAGRPEAPEWFRSDPARTVESSWELDDEVRESLPPAFHRPYWADTLSPPGWFCGVCWTDGTLQGFPCDVALKHGGYLSQALRRGPVRVPSS